MSGNQVFTEELVNIVDAYKYYKALDIINSKTEGTDANLKLFHYTSTRVLNAILAKGCFRASNLFYLNDKIEYKMGITVLRNIFEKDETVKNYIDEISKLNGRDWQGVYSISFSNKEDELQQWITYARESGVCIELNSDIVWNNKDLNLAIKCGENSKQYYKQCFLKLAYEKSNLLSKDKLPQLNANIIKNALAQALMSSDNSDEILDETFVRKQWKENPQHARNFLKLLSAYYKEERFKGEGEIRAAFLSTQKSRKSSSKIEYFEQENGILRPYMDILFMHDYHDTNPYKVECPIQSITIGPGGSQESVFDSVVHRLEFGETKVWQYNLYELSDLISKFVYGCFEQYGKRLEESGDDSNYRKVAEMIVQDWCNKTKYTYKLKEATQISVKVELQDKSEAEPVKAVAVEDEYIKNIVKEFMDNNYFSKTGIWVKKSTLSYIF